MTPTIDSSPPWPEDVRTSPDFVPGPRAVVAEQDPCLRHLIACLLAGEGLFVTEVSDATALVQAAAPSSRVSEPFNLIVADLPMPGSSGFSALERLRQAGCRGPAIVISGELDDLGLAQLERLSAEHLTKPFEVARLRSLASHVCSAYDEARSHAACPP